MPFVRIDTLKKPDPTFLPRAGKVVYEVMRATINIPDRDNFQVLTEHEPGKLVFDASYMDIKRTDGFVAIQITMSEGRKPPEKRALMKGIVQRLQEELDVRPEDVFINLVEVKWENWSFGNGVAQYAA
jgi:phenylpyruvate tautomerase PptA (4-oxalocrotonate tautomerase family)